ncbi:hypothetical protein H072_7730 [Dactylellina haptotyla CBS 200.50]|uniref:Uncharacterized protein n=1 Tax=Dactylellina haptotyla (strain CBS 200.50) TaxID=1284197 RepID=S8A672_DACHA|nr:hypothetical protein H072_7730 [Dactylellina haptotyla CBS 200.50]
MDSTSGIITSSYAEREMNETSTSRDGNNEPGQIPGPEYHFAVQVFLKLEALSTMKPIQLLEDWSLEFLLETVKYYLNKIGYLSPSSADAKNWRIDLSFGDLSVLNTVNLLTYRGEQQSSLLVKDLFYGGEILDVSLYRFSPSQGNLIEYIWDTNCDAWRTRTVPNEFPFLDTRLAVHQDILYTPFPFTNKSLSMSSIKLSYIRILNERLRIPASETSYISAVVFVDIDELKMAVVKKYAWERRQGVGLIVEMESNVCKVKDVTGEERLLRYRINRMMWVED